MHAKPHRGGRRGGGGSLPPYHTPAATDFVWWVGRDIDHLVADMGRSPGPPPAPCADVRGAFAYLNQAYAGMVAVGVGGDCALVLVLVLVGVGGGGGLVPGLSMAGGGGGGGGEEEGGREGVKYPQGLCRLSV